MRTDSMTIGDNIAQLRRRRELTQEDLAERAEVSVETVRKLERNERTSARVSTLNRLAGALAVPTSALFGTSGLPAARRERSSELSLLPLRQVLFPARGIDGPIAMAGNGAPPSLAAVRATVGDIDSAYLADDYATAIGALPGLLAGASAAAETTSTSESFILLAQAHQLAGTILLQVRAFDIAHRALDVAMDAAARAGDELAAASAVVTSCWLLLRQDRLDEAERLAFSTAEHVEPSFARPSADRLGVWGWLMLRVAAAAARNNRADKAVDALDAAAAAARVTNRQRSAVAGPTTVGIGPAKAGSFCPTTVAMKRVEVAVVARDSAWALRLASDVPRDSRPTSDNCNRHLLDVARAQVDHCRYADATRTLQSIRRDAPSWLRHQRYARDILRDLRDAPRRAMSHELSNLLDFVGVTR